MSRQQLIEAMRVLGDDIISRDYGDGTEKVRLTVVLESTGELTISPETLRRTGDLMSAEVGSDVLPQLCWDVLQQLDAGCTGYRFDIRPNGTDAELHPTYSD